jgi:formylglycine-generating enzyme required for sulfatase activity
MLLSLKISIAIGAGIAAALPLALPCGMCGAPLPGEPELVTIAPRQFEYREPGEFTRWGRPVDAPVVSITRKTPLTLMRRQVTAAEYEECMRERGCPPAPQDNAPNRDRPIVKVSWHDANAYASWLSRKIGRTYRLPTDEEWSLAAGSRFVDDSVGAEESVNPSKRWLARYEKESNRDEFDKELKPVGAFGRNEHGLADMAGNVWEWTNTCYRRVALGQGAENGRVTVNCGIRVVAGRHRSYMTDFVRDPRSGGCAVGVPPANLGFRLVRD